MDKSTFAVMANENKLFLNTTVPTTRITKFLDKIDIIIITRT